MGLFWPLRIFFALLAFSALFTVTGAQVASASDPPKERISDGQPLRDNVLLFPMNGQLAINRIDGLLVPLKLWSRQQEVTCTTNHSACQGSQFCCPDGNVCCSGGTCCGAGTYCSTAAGVQGCCKLGHICNRQANECTVADQMRCPNENFCCAVGDTCYRDADNNPRCIPGAGSPTPTGSLSPKPTQSGPVSTSTSSPSFCRLKPARRLGLFNRRRQAPVHPTTKRWGWF